MKIPGNNLATSFVYTTQKASNELHYGHCPLVYYGDTDNGVWKEIGYSPLYVDAGTRFLFYTNPGISGITYLPDPTLVYHPCQVDNKHDVPKKVDDGGLNWIEDDVYGLVAQFTTSGLDSYYNLGQNHKSLHIQPGESFMLEAMIKPTPYEHQSPTQEDLIFRLGWSASPVYGGIYWCINNPNWAGGEDDEDRDLWCSIYTGPGSNDRINLYSTPVAHDTWQHVAVIWSHNNNTVSMYVDGEEVDNADITGRELYNPYAVSGLAENYLCKNFSGYIDMAKVSVGEYTPADFCYTYYNRDYYGNTAVFPFFFEKDKPYSIYNAWESGEVYYSLPVELPATESYTAGILMLTLSGITDALGLTSISGISFEASSGEPLEHCVGDFVYDAFGLTLAEGQVFVYTPFPQDGGADFDLILAYDSSVTKPSATGNIDLYEDAQDLGYQVSQIAMPYTFKQIDRGTKKKIVINGAQYV